MGDSDRTFVDKCIRNDKGSVTIFQRPNLTILVWAIATLLTKITSGTINSFLGLVAFGALFTWAWLELFHGANYLRRLLGFVVIAVSIYGKL